jgi:hypothetical protein
VVVSFIGGDTGVPGEKQWPAPSQRQTLLDKVVSSTPRLGWIRIHNVSCKT